jgi:hypothetical protein
MVAFPTRGETDNNPITLEIHIKKVIYPMYRRKAKGREFLLADGGPESTECYKNYRQDFKIIHSSRRQRESKLPPQSSWKQCVLPSPPR